VIQGQGHLQWVQGQTVVELRGLRSANAQKASRHGLVGCVWCCLATVA